MQTLIRMLVGSSLLEMIQKKRTTGWIPLVRLIKWVTKTSAIRHLLS